MRWRTSLICILLMGLTALLSPARASLPQDYLQIYLKLNESERLGRSGDFRGAVTGFQECYQKLQKIRETDPDWETALVHSRMEDCRAKINVYLGEAGVEAATATTSTPTVNPALAQASDAVRATDLPLKSEKHTAYPWKTNIITTVFWMSDDAPGFSLEKKAPHLNKGNSDDLDNSSGYASAKHASTRNPFYVALPFNDLAYPEKAHQWVPAGWLKPAHDGKPVSACLDRWVEIKSRTGRVCFAQWRDVGPDRADHAEYVFGSERPDTGNRAGLDVSPAVAKYLGVNKETITSWRFADDDDVLPGMWTRYDEQAILFKALHESKKSDASPSSP